MINRSIHSLFCAFSSGKYSLAMVRHGQSIWNKQKKWAGWTDIPLSSYGIKQIKQCAGLLKNKSIPYDVVYTSVLSRCIKSTNYLLDQLDLHYLPVYKQWRLNQKHYGALQGCSKVEIKEKHGEQIVTKWRRSMDIPPPTLEKTHESHPLNNPMYKDIDPNILPSSECLSDIIKRVKPLWQQKISPDIKSGKNVLIVGHGSSIRSLVAIITPGITEQQLKNFNIPNATPIIFTLDENLCAVGKEYLGDINQIKRKMNKIKYETERKQV